MQRFIGNIINVNAYIWTNNILIQVVSFNSVQIIPVFSTAGARYHSFTFTCKEQEQAMAVELIQGKSFNLLIDLEDDLIPASTNVTLFPDSL